MNNREKILSESLNLFSKKGYNAVSVRDIAKAVGIKESSIYNHFNSKQDIFDSIVKDCSKRNDAFFHQVQLTGDDLQFKVDERTIEMYKNMTPEQFTEVSTQIFEFYFTDEINVKFRKMLTIEQFSSHEISKIFKDLYFDGSINFQSQLFDTLIKVGCFIETDPYVLALEFFSPIFLLFYKFDNDEEGLKEAKSLFIRHIEHFNKIYTKQKD